MNLLYRVVFVSGAVVMLFADVAAAESHSHRRRAAADCQTTSAVLIMGGLLGGARNYDPVGGAQTGAGLASVMCDGMMSSAEREDRRATHRKRRQAQKQDVSKSSPNKSEERQNIEEARVYKYQNK